MTGLSKEDWGRVNAYHDGAFSPEDAKAFETRLRDEPVLAAALAEVKGISRSLRALRPVVTETLIYQNEAERPGPEHTTARFWWIGGSFVASVLLVIALGIGHIATKTPLEVHKAFVEQQFDEDRSFNLSAASLSPDQPDLTGGNLTSVALQEFQDWSVAHYAGRNGCRLSYFRGRGTLVLPPDPHTQISAWSTIDGMQHAIIATGMDEHRFDAIGAYVHETTKQLAIDHVYASMVDATERATPCVG